MAHGTPVDVAMTKWGDRPHWRFSGTYLGADAHGQWLGFPRGTHYARPGAEVEATVDAVTLVPAGARPWLATFHSPGLAMDVYVDIATPASWDGSTLRSIDLDLDVVGLVDGATYVDDEDEFAEHRVSLGYPDDLVATAEAAAAEVLAAVAAGAAPYDGSAQPWLDLVAQRGGGSASVDSS